MAEAPTPETLLTQERELLLDTFDYTFAWELGRRMHGKAVAAGMPVAIEITHGADPVFFALAPGATPDNKDWVRRKRNVALRFQHSSLYMRVMAEKTGINFNSRYRLPETEFAASGGGVPLVLRHGGIIGAAAVSGMPDVEDHRLITATLQEMISR